MKNEANAKTYLTREDYMSRWQYPWGDVLSANAGLDTWANKPQSMNDPFYVAQSQNIDGIPTVMFHGYGDNCLQPGNIFFN